MYGDILRRLRVAVIKKQPEKWRKQQLVPLHDNTPAHQSVLIKDFLAKYNLTIIKYHPIS